MVARKRTPAKPVAPKQEATPEPAKLVNWSGWIITAIVAVVAVNHLAKYWRGGSKPEPTPVVAVDKLTAEAFKVMAAEYEKFHVEAARSIKSGDIKTDAELYAALKPSREAALRKAFTPIDDYVEAGLQRDNHILKPESAEFLETLGKAFGKAVK